MHPLFAYPIAKSRRIAPQHAENAKSHPSAPHINCQPSTIRSSNFEGVAGAPRNAPLQCCGAAMVMHQTRYDAGLVRRDSEILVGLALFASAAISIWVTRAAPGGIALIWPGSAIAAALLIRLPRARWRMAAVSVLLAIFFANILVAHRQWQDAALFAGVNSVEITLAVLAFRSRPSHL